jgi:hypothetical protein
MVVDKNNRGESGQALFELIVFLPFMLFFFMVMVSIGNSINGSINQEKATRRYFFYLAKGNSRLPDTFDLNEYKNNGVINVQQAALAWSAKRLGAKDNYGGCYQINSLFDSDLSDECDAPAIEDSKTRFVRVFTAFGVCGTSYSLNSGTNQYDTSDLQTLTRCFNGNDDSP